MGNVVAFTQMLPLGDFLAECCVRAATGASAGALREYWKTQNRAIRSSQTYDDLIEFLIAVDDATRPLQPGATELLPLPDKLRFPPSSIPRLVSPLGQQARELYGDFSAAYPYLVPLQAIFGDDDPALFIARAGRARFPVQDRYPLVDAGRYDGADLTSFGIGKANRWLTDELLEWAAAELEPRLVKVLRMIADGKIEECSTPPDGMYGAQTCRGREMLTLYIMRRALSDGLVSSLFHFLVATEYDDFLDCDLEPEGSLSYCLSPRNLDSLARAAKRIGGDADAEARPDEHYFVFVVLGAIASVEADSMASLSLATTKRILDRLVEIGHWEGMAGLMRSMAIQRNREMEVIEPGMLGILADSLGGGDVLAPPRRFAQRSGVESFLAHGLTTKQLDQVLESLAVHPKSHAENLVSSREDLSNDFLSYDQFDAQGFVERYRYAIDCAVMRGESELASSLVAFLIFAVGYRTGGTFRGRCWLKRNPSQIPGVVTAGAEGLLEVDGVLYSSDNRDFGELLALVPIGLGLKGRERVEKALRFLVARAKADRQVTAAERLLSYLPSRSPIMRSKRVSVGRLVTQGESHTVEFKETIRFDVQRNAIEKSDERMISLQWLKAIAAFLNADGGHLLIGVADDGTIRGLERDGFDSADKRQRFMRERIDTVIGPNAHAYVTYTEPVSRGERLIYIHCRAAAPDYVWFHPGKNSTEQLVVRTGPKNKLLEGRALAEFLARRAVTGASQSGSDGDPAPG